MRGPDQIVQHQAANVQGSSCELSSEDTRRGIRYLVVQNVADRLLFLTRIISAAGSNLKRLASGEANKSSPAKRLQNCCPGKGQFAGEAEFNRCQLIARVSLIFAQQRTCFRRSAPFEGDEAYLGQGTRSVESTEIDALK